MSTYRQHRDLASERFDAAERLFQEEEYHTAAHLHINAAINYHNALCQKYLKYIPSHKHHSDTGYLRELAPFIGPEFSKYQDAYEFLMAHKSGADYGVGLSMGLAEQVRRRALKIRAIAEPLL